MVRLQGKRILVVEDEPIIGEMLKGMLSDLGAVVAATARTEEDARLLAEEAEIDAGVLDVNLNGERSFVAAETLRRRRVPFVFATGYGPDTDIRVRGSIVVEKPYRLEQLEAALLAALDEGVRAA
jgi:CheY-like chemotaxis protein